MPLEESRKQFLRDMRLGSLHVDQARIMDEMETMAEYLTEWIARCREGNVPAWVLYGQMHLDVWEVMEKLENMFGPELGPELGPESDTEGIVLDG
ncbi:MAG: hypothetical protein OXP66_04560 [Candidatus Tectomicrobia bacterium]|nr:hypothetical protein [Candidatus Tectomicrobia bacterium]